MGRDCASERVPIALAVGWPEHPCAKASAEIDVAAVSSHALGDFEDEPAERGEADAPEKYDRDHSLLLFLHDIYGLRRQMEVTNCS